MICSSDSRLIKRSLIVINALIAYRWGIGAILVGQVGISTGHAYCV